MHVSPIAAEQGCPNPYKQNHTGYPEETYQAKDSAVPYCFAGKLTQQYLKAALCPILQQMRSRQ